MHVNRNLAGSAGPRYGWLHSVFHLASEGASWYPLREDTAGLGGRSDGRRPGVHRRGRLARAAASMAVLSPASAHRR